VDPIIEAVLKREGGDSDRIADRGGLTRFGITKPFLRDYGSEGQTIESLTIDDARTLYGVFMKATGIARIQNDVLRGVVFDAAVNHGPIPAIKLLQRALGIRADGIFGSQTLAALPYLKANKLAILFCTQRLRLYAELVAGNLEDRDRDGIPDNVEMIRGWINRTCIQIEGLA